MDAGVPSLYLDPLLPFALRPDPRSIPFVAGSIPATAIVIAVSGAYRAIRADAPALAIEAPGLLWCGTKEPLSLTVNGAERRAWLLVIGQQLVDQLVVSAFGEPGLCRFIDGFLKPGTAPAGTFPHDLIALLQELARELHERPPAFRVRARSVLMNVLLFLYRATLTADPTTNSDGFRVASVVDHIELNYGDHLDLELLAAQMETSPTHLSRVFRREVGVPLFEYINRTRVRKACVLLRRTEFPVTRIAIDVGYNNVSFFNRYFKRIMRCSPSEYRRTIRQ